MKVIVTVAGSRSGNEFFLSLLDGHSEILQFPGAIRGNNRLIQILSNKHSEKVAQEFIDSDRRLFDSRLTKHKKGISLERHDYLGENKDQFYVINQTKFKKSFCEFMEDKNEKIRNILFFKYLNLHKAYMFSMGHDIRKKKLLVINAHIIDNSKFFSQNILKEINFDIIHTIRHPLSGLSSPLKWLGYESGKYFFANSIFHHIDLVFNSIKNLNKINNKIFIIKLETLHMKNLVVMKNFCKIYNLDYEVTMEKSTFHNLKWWGDKISSKDQNGINKNFKVNYDRSNFYDKDIIFLNTKMKEFMKKYNYSNSIKAKSTILNLLPMKCEILTWKNTLKNKKIKHILSIPYYYLKRIILVNLQNRKNIIYPPEIGEI